MKFKLERATEKFIDFEGAKLETVRKSFWGEDLYYSFSIEIDSLEKLLEIAKIEEHGIIIDRCRTGSPYEWRIVQQDNQTGDKAGRNKGPQKRPQTIGVFLYTDRSIFVYALPLKKWQNMTIYQHIRTVRKIPVYNL